MSNTTELCLFTVRSCGGFEKINELFNTLGALKCSDQLQGRSAKLEITVHSCFFKKNIEGQGWALHFFCIILERICSSVAGVKLWKSLSDDLKESIVHFKSKLEQITMEKS